MDTEPTKTNEDYRVALEEIDRLFDGKHGTPDGDRLEAMVMLVEAYEAEHYPVVPLFPYKATGRLSRSFNNLRWKLWRLFIIARFAATDNCGLSCGVVPIRQLDGTIKDMFVPEADCPIHDIGLKEGVEDCR